MKRLSNNTVAFIVCTVIICYVIALIRLDAINIIVEPLNGIFYELTVSREMQDLKEIQTNVAECQNEYQSEIGFGNDRFTIYSFSLKSAEKLGTLHRLDKGFEETYTNYLELIDMELVMAKPFKKVKLLALKHILEKCLKQIKNTCITVITSPQVLRSHTFIIAQRTKAIAC